MGDIADYLLTLAHAPNSVVIAVQRLDPDVVCAGASRRQIAVGHDLGDWVDAGGMDKHGPHAELKIGD